VFSRGALSSRRVRSSRAQLRLRSLTGEQQEIWRHQSRRDGAVQETRPGDKLVSLTGEVGREEEGSKRPSTAPRPLAGIDGSTPTTAQAKPHTQLIALSHVPCHLAITDGLRPEGSSAVPTCSLQVVVSLAAPETATGRLQPVCIVA
jgi:hypothetical protein